MTNALAQIEAQLATKTTEELIDMSAALQGKQDEAGRAVRACVAGEVITRHNLDDLMEEVYLDDDFEGTYHEAMMIAIARVGA